MSVSEIDSPWSESSTSFGSGGLSCGATLFTPKRAPALGPCVVMAGGLGSIRAVGLPPYARGFASRGYRVLSFDYRYWGESAGEPRHLLSIARQLEDWAAAVSFARSLPGVDADKIALWGSSMSGGHVVCTAANDPRIAALTAQCPMMDGRAAALRVLRYAGPGPALRLGALGVIDLLKTALGLPPQRVLVSAVSGTLALMSGDENRAGIERLYAEAGLKTEGKRAPARIALQLRKYRPILSAPHVRCPALIIACENDSVAPVEAAKAAARAMGEFAELVTCSYGHFDIYVDAGFQFSFARQLAHFDRVFGSQMARDRAELQA